MADEIVTPAPVTPAPAEQTPQNPATVPYERFAEVNTKYRTLETQLADLTKAQKEQAENALKEQNKYKELYEQREKELTKERQERMRLTVATSKGLPVDLANRLAGETEAELQADADKLLLFLKPTGPQPTLPGLPPIRPGGGSGIDLMTETDPAKIREAMRKK